MTEGLPGILERYHAASLAARDAEFFVRCRERKGYLTRELAEAWRIGCAPTLAQCAQAWAAAGFDRATCEREYAFVAEPRPLQQIDIQDVLERADDEAFEGASDHLQGLPELEAAFKTFYELNKNIVSYHADETRAIAVPRPTKV